MHVDRYFEFIEDYYSELYVERKAEHPSEERSVLKIGEEVGELQGAILKRFPIKEREEEWADALFSILLHGITSGYNIRDAMNRVVEKNQVRIKTGKIVDGIVVKQADCRN